MKNGKTAYMAIVLKTFAIYVFGVVISVFSILFYAESFLGFTLLYILLILAALSLWGALTARRRIKIILSVPKAVTERAQPYTYTLRLKSGGLWTYYGLMVKLADPRWTEKEDLAGAAISRHETQLTYTVTYPYCGVYPCGATAVSAREFLGLFRVYVPCRRGPEDVAVVLPAYDAAFRLPLTQQQEGQSQALQLQPGVGSDVQDLRDYTPEDSLRHIHWKVSARRDALIVKEYADDTRPGILVLPALGEGEPVDLAFLQMRDRLAASAASVLYDCVRSRIPAELIVSGHARPVETVGEFETAREALAWLPSGTEEAEDGIRRALETHSEAAGAVLLVTELTATLLDTVESAVRRGWQVCLYHVPRTGDDAPETLQKRLAELERGGAVFETICA